MPTTPRSPTETARRPTACRVRFHAPLLGAKLVARELPSPPAAPPASPSPSRLSAPPSPPVVPAPKDFWATDAGREILADRANIEAVLGAMHDAVAEFRKNQSARLADWQRAAVELAMTIATRLLHERIESGDFPIEAKARDMIAQLGEEEVAAVRLNSDDLELLKSRLGGEPLFPERSDLKLIADETLARGDCRVEGRESMLLSEVSRELQEIRDELLRSLAHAWS